jgi:hypothetical protein
MAMAFWILVCALLIYRHLRATRRLKVEEFSSSQTVITQVSIIDCSVPEAEKALLAICATLRKVRIVEEVPDGTPGKVLLDVSPSVFSLDDFSGLGVTATLHPSDANPGKTKLELSGFPKALGPSDSALRSFSMRLRNKLKSEGVNEFDRYR